MKARADAGEAGADDEDVEMFDLHDIPCPGGARPRRDLKDVDARHKAGHDDY